MSGKKRQELPRNAEGGLWVVATPIGNLQDLSPRAQAALSEADAILCEDTRQTSKLLAFLGISVPLQRFDQHASEAQALRLVEEMAEGKRYALVSDAGTPAISDPGAALVKHAHEQGVAVTPVPGPTAVAALLSAAGFESTGFGFLGFAPRSAKELETQVDGLKSGPIRTWVWFESPHRVAETVQGLERLLPHSRMAAGKELTKLHEKIYSGSVKNCASQVLSEIATEGDRGEWVIAVEIGVEDLAKEGDESALAEKIVRALMNAGVSASRAASEASQSFGISRNLAYEIATRVKKV